MNFLFLLLISACAVAGEKEKFFPALGGSVIEVISLDRSIEQSLEQRDDTYRLVVNYKVVSPIQYSVARPLVLVGQYDRCRTQGKMLLVTNTHYEPTYFESQFKCVDGGPGHDPLMLHRSMAARFCTDVESNALDAACKRAKLK